VAGGQRYKEQFNGFAMPNQYCAETHKRPLPRKVQKLVPCKNPYPAKTSSQPIFLEKVRFEPPIYDV
jgi:hypothetical protein